MRCITIEDIIYEMELATQDNVDGICFSPRRTFFYKKTEEQLNKELAPYGLKAIYDPTSPFDKFQWLITKIDCHKFDHLLSYKK